MGRAAATAAQNLDVLTATAFTMFSAVLLIVANLVVDVLYAYFDPRVRLG